MVAVRPLAGLPRTRRQVLSTHALDVDRFTCVENVSASRSLSSRFAAFQA
jgi:hypothetical protein